MVRHKFNVSPNKSLRMCDDILFDSKWEMEVYKILKDAIPAHHLHLQPTFTLLDKFRGPDGAMRRAITYVGDFLLGDPIARDVDLHSKHIVIDCKGMETEVFKIKHKLFTAKFNAIIQRPKTGQKKKVKELIDQYWLAW